MEDLADVPLGRGLRVAVVALEQGGAGEVADLADRLGRVGESAVGVELRQRTLAAVLVEDRHIHVRARDPERARRGVGGPGDHHPALAAAVRLAWFHVEPSSKLGAVVHRGLGAKDDPQRGLCLLGPLGLGQYIGQRAAHVVDVGGAELQNIGKEARGGELAAHGERAAHVRRRRERRHQRIAVEQRHRAVRHVAADEPAEVNRAEHGQPPGGTHDGLRRARRSRGEQQRQQRVRVAGVLVQTRRRAGVRGEEFTPLPGPHVHTLGDTGLQVGEQRGAVVVAQNDVTVDTTDIRGEFRAAARGVDADDRHAGHRGAAQQEQVLRHVLEQDAHVEAPVGDRSLGVGVGEALGPVAQDLGAHGRLGHKLPPRPARVLEPEAGVVIGRPLQQDLAECRERHVVSGVEIGEAHERRE